MSEMSSLTEGHAENCVTRFKQGMIDCHVRLGTGMWLDIDVFSTEECFRAFNRERFNIVHKLASVIVTLAGVALSVFIGEDTALDFHNSATCVVLGWDQHERILLTFQVIGGDFNDLWVDFT